MPSSRHSKSSSKSKRSGSPKNYAQRLIRSLESHNINTMTGLCRIERRATELEDNEDAVEFHLAMTNAWLYYVEESNHLLVELQGLTSKFPFVYDIVRDAITLVRIDPESDRSWNMAWLVLCKIRDAGLIPPYAQSESWKPEMWGGRSPTHEEADELEKCFILEWAKAVEHLLKHWITPPVSY